MRPVLYSTELLDSASAATNDKNATSEDEQAAEALVLGLAPEPDPHRNRHGDDEDAAERDQLAGCRAGRS